MGTPRYTTDIIPLTSRPTLTVMDDGDYFVILDTSTGKISKMLRTDVQKALSISYGGATGGLTATQVQDALDELVVNLGSLDSAISAIKGTGWDGQTIKGNADAIATLNADDTTEGSVAKAVKDGIASLNGQWITPTLVNGWAHYGGVTSIAGGYMKDSQGFVHLDGQYTGGSDGTIVYILPAGFRPRKSGMYRVAGENSNARALVGSSGSVYLFNMTTYIALDGITFKADL